MIAPELVPVGQDAQGVRAGDFILCHRRGLVSALIRLGERLRLRRAEVSHAALCRADGYVYEALVRGVCVTPLAAYRDVEYWIVRMEMQTTDQRQAIRFARSCVGERYGWLTIVGIALRFLTPGRGLWLGMDGTEICSGLVAEALVRGWSIFRHNPGSLTPQELFDYAKRE